MFTIEPLKRSAIVLAAMSLLAVLWSSCTETTPPPATTTVSETTTPKDTVGSAQAKRLETWRLSMARIKLPKIGAFEASYPDTVWHEVD
ncbi:MAG: hypothetical protein WAU70_12535, partial [Flavobacteriales bacterium]